MTQEHSHHPSGPLALAVTLAVVAGFIDAHIYLHVTPVFVANMSGNLVHLGIFAGEGDWREAVGTSVAVLSFLLGVIGATIHHDRRLLRHGAVRPGALLAVEAGLLLVLPILMVTLSVEFTPQPRWADYPVLVVGGLAMGLQAAALRRVGQIAVATTYGTGAIVRIGEKLALAVRKADHAHDHRRSVTVAVLVLVLVSYVGGAVLAAVLGSSPAFLLLPVAALVGATAWLRASG